MSSKFDALIYSFEVAPAPTFIILQDSSITESLDRLCVFSVGVLIDSRTSSPLPSRPL